MPQFNQQANFDSLTMLGTGTDAGAGAYIDPVMSGVTPNLYGGQTAGVTPNPYGGQTAGAQEDYELISLLNPNQNQGENQNAGGDANQPLSELARAMQQQVQLQQTNLQRDIEFRQQQMLENQRRLQEQQLEEQRKQLEDQRKQLMQNLIPEIDENSITLTPEEQKTYGGSLDFVRKVATQAQREILNKMAPGIQQLAENQLKMQQTIEQFKNGATGNALSAQQQQDVIIQAQVPNAAELVADPRFARYKQQPSQIPGFTNGDLIDLAYRQGRSTAVIAQLRNFQQSLTGKQPPVNVQGMQTGAAPVQSNQRVQKLRRSEYDHAVEQYHMGLMDQETFDKIDAQFQTALVQGRVVDL